MEANIILIFCKVLSYDLRQLFVTTVTPIRRTRAVFSSKCMTCTLQKDKENKWYIFWVSLDVCIKYSKIIFTVQNCCPRSHLLGRSSMKLSSVIGSAEHLQNKHTIQPICNVMLFNINCTWEQFLNFALTYVHSPSLSHKPVFFSLALQLSWHDHSPILHRNPASTSVIVTNEISKSLATIILNRWFNSVNRKF